MKKTIVFFLLLFSFEIHAQWTNPLTLNDEWSYYGIGDPYILKYRGVYYLYCSTKDGQIGVKCWSTKDFITWSGPYNCTNEPITVTAYAPEVVYWNGTFYMYTSPGGNGHYVLSSNSPTGPFVRISGNLGNSIDGSVFIDDNGTWYFYHAGFEGIYGCLMTSPTSIGYSINLNARVGNEWTEGPCVIKRDGTYYLLYTGNNVLCNAYRVDYAKNTIGPINTYNPQKEQNPILIKSEGTFVGLGHGTAFIGPDLDSYYFTYHNFAGDYGVGPYRRLNFDRIAWNGDKLLLLGPTTWEQQVMRLADMSDFFERDTIGANWLTPNGGNWTIKNRDHLVQSLSDNEYKVLFIQPSESDYTAEFTMKGEAESDNLNPRFGAVFSYSDEANYGIAVLCSNSKQLEISFKKDNVWGPSIYSNLPSNYNPDAWNHLRIEKSGTSYKFVFNGMQKAAITHALGAGKIGYISSGCSADFGYIAFSNKSKGSGIFDIYKPVPGAIQAVHYNTGGEGIGYHDLTPENSGNEYIRYDNVDISSCSEGGFAISDNQTGEWYKYNVNVKVAGLYNVGFRYAAATSAGRIRIRKGDIDLTDIIPLPTTGGLNQWNTFTIPCIELLAGFQTLTLETVNGGFNFYEMEFTEADSTIVTLTDTFDTNFSTAWNYVDGQWRIESGAADINGYGKRTMGNTGWTDYTVQTDITYYGALNGGLIFRVNNPALGGSGNDPGLGTDFLQGYFVGLSANAVILGKHNYAWTQLATAQGNYVSDRTYTLKVVVFGSNIQVYVDDMETPKIKYTDAHPFISGKVGLRVSNTHARFDNFSVTTHKVETPPLKINLPSKQDEVKLFPNPAKTNERIHIFQGNNRFQEKMRIEIFSLTGNLVSCQQTQENIFAPATPGLYIVNVKSSDWVQSIKLIVR
jgi:hypothetical protein